MIFVFLYATNKTIVLPSLHPQKNTIKMKCNVMLLGDATGFIVHKRKAKGYTSCDSLEDQERQRMLLWM